MLLACHKVSSIAHFLNDRKVPNADLFMMCVFVPFTSPPYRRKYKFDLTYCQHSLVIKIRDPSFDRVTSIE